MELDLFPNDIIEKIRKLYFTMYVLPTINLWRPVLGCICDLNILPIVGFISRAISWASTYLHSFYPSYMKYESCAYCEFLQIKIRFRGSFLYLENLPLDLCI